MRFYGVLRGVMSMKVIEKEKGGEWKSVKGGGDSFR